MWKNDKKWFIATFRAGTKFIYKQINLKIYLLSIATGIIVGLVTVPYRYIIMQSVTLRDFLYGHHYSWYIHIAIVLGLWIVGMLLFWMVKKNRLLAGSGIPQVEGYMCNRFEIKHTIWQIIQKFFGGVTAVGMGLSLGREGPSVQIGGLIANLIGKWTKVDDSNRRFLISSGAAAGLSSAFTAPLASTIFVHEEITKYQSSRSSVTSLLAAIAAGWMAKMVFSNNEYVTMSSAMPDTSELRIILVTMIGLAFFLAVCGKIFNFLILFILDNLKNYQIPSVLHILIVVSITYLLGYFIPDILAGGEPLIFRNANVGGSIWMVLLFLIIKLIYTPLCYSTGFPGGIFLPLLVIGALAGKLFVLFLCKLGLPYQTYSGFFMLMSMGGIFAVVVRAPVTGLVLILEMTSQFADFFYMIVLVGLTFFISELMGVKPIYNMLYLRMLPKDYETSNKKIQTYYRILEGAYFIGKTINDVKIPEYTAILRFKRDEVWLDDRAITLQKGDLIEVEFESKDLELLYKSFRALCNE